MARRKREVARDESHSVGAVEWATDEREISATSAESHAVAAGETPALLSAQAHHLQRTRKEVSFGGWLFSSDQADGRTRVVRPMPRTK